eukprot:2744883-Prymnesium_polylepis.1
MSMASALPSETYRRTFRSNSYSLVVFSQLRRWQSRLLFVPRGGQSAQYLGVASKAASRTRVSDARCNRRCESHGIGARSPRKTASRYSTGHSPSRSGRGAPPFSCERVS